MKRTGKKIKILALCSMLAALGVVVLLLGSFIEVLDLSAAMFASLIVVIAVIEAGKYWPWLTYAVTSLTALLLLPYKLPAVMYLLAGYYPIIKEKIEKLPKPIAWIIKLSLFNLSLALVLLVLKLFLPGVSIELVPGLKDIYTYLIYYASGNIIFVLYDILLTRLVSFYVFKLRDRLGIGNKK